MASLLPIRCFTCGKVLAHSEEIFKVDQTSPEFNTTLEKFGFTRWCCKRMFLGHDPNLFDKELKFSAMFDSLGKYNTSTR